MALAMPSMQHEAVVELLRDAELVRVLLAIANVRAVGTPQVVDATLTAPEMRAGPSRLAVVIEVQRNRDAKKKWAWRSCASRMRGVRARLRDGRRRRGVGSSAHPPRPSQFVSRRGVYYELILEALDKAAAKELEEWMDFKNYEFKSDFAKRNFAAGKEAGKAEGELLGAREALYDVLAARRFEVGEYARARIDACRDVVTLRTWIARAAVADSIAEVLE